MAERVRVTFSTTDPVAPLDPLRIAVMKPSEVEGEADSEVTAYNCPPGQFVEFPMLGSPNYLKVSYNAPAIVATPASPVNTSPPMVSGSLVEGATLTADPGTWDGDPAPTFTYQWKVNDIDVLNETNQTFVAVPGDVSVAVTGTNVAGSSTVTSNPLVVPVTGVLGTKHNKPPEQHKPPEPAWDHPKSVSDQIKDKLSGGGDDYKKGHK